MVFDIDILSTYRLHAARGWQIDRAEGRDAAGLHRDALTRKTWLAAGAFGWAQAQAISPPSVSGPFIAGLCGKARSDSRRGKFNGFSILGTEKGDDYATAQHEQRGDNPTC
ncbi:hypothetical protein [Bradyrhizobium sp. CCGUVB23]|uniref:hypothetical protein n=1 Tax=Bradyrhizobium sp. CCGUVB23 TaxID=2949630 RepID=UPI0020B22968|nr:hypothetical protein [Bradyrhizobium sp. CCGUVB23]MCP3468014.1 hypothetical protein [Bradyrhizobium sp. CCGUVB23]